jgi:hypothetical protein
MFCALFAAKALPRYMRELPGIPTVDGTTWIGVGHFRSEGGGRRNPFGLVSVSLGSMLAFDAAAHQIRHVRTQQKRLRFSCNLMHM